MTSPQKLHHSGAAKDREVRVQGSRMVRLEQNAAMQTGLHRRRNAPERKRAWTARGESQHLRCGCIRYGLCAGGIFSSAKHRKILRHVVSRVIVGVMRYIVLAAERRVSCVAFPCRRGPLSSFRVSSHGSRSGSDLVVVLLTCHESTTSSRHQIIETAGVASLRDNADSFRGATGHRNAKQRLW